MEPAEQDSTPHLQLSFARPPCYPEDSVHASVNQRERESE